MCGRKLLLVCLLVLLLSLPFFSDVTLTDAEYSQIMTSLDKSETELKIAKAELTIARNELSALKNQLTMLRQAFEMLNLYCEGLKKDQIAGEIRAGLSGFIAGGLTGLSVKIFGGLDE